MIGRALRDPQSDDAVVAAGIDELCRRPGFDASRADQESAQVAALVELLVAKGLIDADELSRQRGDPESRVEAEYEVMGMKVHVGHEPDKYAMEGEGVEIDCGSRLHLCRAACCRLRFPLTPQDIREGVVQWQPDQPYMNRQREDGYCVHCSAGGGRCQVYEQRPAVCRRYDCRQDRRIWLDFERRIVNPDVLEATDG